MEAAPSIEEVVAMCEAMNTPGHSQQEIQRASEFLKAVQDTVHAWDLAHQILNARSSEAACFWAAQTMRYKIQHRFNELPIEMRESLRDAIAPHLCHYASLSVACSTQLCLAVADLAVYIDTWKNAIGDMIALMSANPESTGALLEFLTVLPEEVRNTNLKVTEGRRRAIERDMEFESIPVYPYLCTVWENNPHDITLRRKTLKCLDSYVRFGGEGSKQLATCPLLTYAFESLDNPELAEEATNVVASAALLSGNNDDHIQLRELLIPAILSLSDKLETALASGDEDMAYNLSIIFSELAFSDIEAFVHDPQEERMVLIERVLQCVTFPDARCAGVSFGFWFTLADTVYDEFSKKDASMRDEVYAHFAPYYCRLYESLLQHVKCEDDQVDVLSGKSDIDDQREKIHDIFSETAFLVGSGNVTRSLLEIFTQHGAHWTIIEACLFVCCALAPNVKDKDPVAGEVLSFVSSLGLDIHPQLRLTATMLIGSYADWIAANTHALDTLFTFVMQGIEVPQLRKAIVKTIKALASSCRNNMSGHFETLLQIIGACEQLQLSQNDVLDLYKAAGRILARLDPASISHCMEQVCSPLIHQIHAILADAKDARDISALLDDLAQVFRHVNINDSSLHEDGTHPCWEMAQRTWEVIQAVLARHAGSTKLVEAALKCLKWVIRCLDERCLPMVPAITQDIVSLFEIQRSSACLYAASVLVSVFGSDEGNVEWIMDMVSHLTGGTFETLSGEDSITQNPDLVEDYFRLMEETIKKLPFCVICSDLAPQVLECATHCTLLAQRDANEIVMLFLSCFWSSGRKGLTMQHEQYSRDIQNALMTLLQTQGEALTQRLIHAACGGLPPYMMSDVSEVIWEMMRLAKDPVVHWIAQSPSLLAAPAQVASDEAKANLVSVLSAAESKTSIQGALKEFSRLFA